MQENKTTTYNVCRSVSENNDMCVACNECLCKNVPFPNFSFEEKLAFGKAQKTQTQFAILLHYENHETAATIKKTLAPSL